MTRSAIAVLTATIAAVLSCGAGGITPRPAASLPMYDAHAAQLFDDTIEPRAMGYELDRTPPPMNDALLRERAQVGDAVVRARVTTITSKEEDKGRSWQIGFHTVERLGGSGPLPIDFVAQIDSNGASAGIMRSFGGRLIGTTFVVFAREFARPDGLGDTDLHVHLVQDDKADVAAVHSAFTTDKVR
jgi:hypothetical protein